MQPWRALVSRSVDLAAVCVCMWRSACQYKCSNSRQMLHNVILQSASCFIGSWAEPAQMSRILLPHAINTNNNNRDNPVAVTRGRQAGGGSERWSSVCTCERLLSVLHMALDRTWHTTWYISHTIWENGVNQVKACQWLTDSLLKYFNRNTKLKTSPYVRIVFPVKNNFA